MSNANTAIVASRSTKEKKRNSTARTPRARGNAAKRTKGIDKRLMWSVCDRFETRTGTDEAVRFGERMPREVSVEAFTDVCGCFFDLFSALGSLGAREGLLDQAPRFCFQHLHERWLHRGVGL
jgi:hypothetical protein